MYKIAKNKYGLYCIPNSSAYTFTSKRILSGKVHEEVTLKFLEKNYKDGDIIHAGAGFGDFFPALSKINKNIWSFEPNPENFFCAEKTIQLNNINNVFIFNIGLGETNKKGFLKIQENDLALGVRSQLEETETKDTIDINIYKLDDIIPETTKISIIHLDTEGLEFQILNGAKNIIEKYKPLIILEIDQRPLVYNEYMLSLGYKPFKQLIYDAKDMVFVNTVYKYSK